MDLVARWAVLLAVGLAAGSPPGPAAVTAPLRPRPGPPIVDAAWDGDATEVTRLLDAGARVGVRGPDGWTPLLAAAAAGHAGVVEVLLARGADPNQAAPDGLTPLAAARIGDHLAVVRRLLQAGARDPTRPPRAKVPPGPPPVTPGGGSGR
jgi:ankyrin repeat protein